MPGAVEVVDDLAASAGFDLGGVPVRGVVGEDAAFGSAVFRYELAPGTPFDDDGGIEGAARVFADHTVTSTTPVETPFGPGVDAEFVGTMPDGQKGVAFIRIVHVGDVPYLLCTYGYASSSPEVQQLHQHLLDSFRVPA